MTFEIQLRYPGTERYFSDFLAVGGSPTAHLQVTQEDLQRASCYCPSDAPPEFLETVALRRRFADLLLSYSRCLFHSAAFAFQGKAYLLAAPSGVGKTTQLNLWWQLYPGEITIINGDKPALQFQDNGPILVHATPWRGKEALAGTGVRPPGRNRVSAAEPDRPVPPPPRQPPPSAPYWVSVFAQTGPKPTTGASAFAQAAGTCRPHLATGKPGRAGIYTALP